MRRARLSLPTPGSPRISKGTVGSTRWPIVTSWRSRAVFRTVVAQPGYRALLTLFLLIADDERRTRSKCGAVGKRARNTQETRKKHARNTQETRKKQRRGGSEARTSSGILPTPRRGGGRFARVRLGPASRRTWTAPRLT